MKPWLKILLIALAIMILFAAWRAYSSGKNLVESIKSGLLYPFRVLTVITAVLKSFFAGGDATTGSGLSEIADKVLRDSVTSGQSNVTAGEGGTLIYTERNNPAPSGVEIVPGSYASTLFTQ